MLETTEQINHRFLDGNMELAVLPVPGCALVAFEIRFFAGYAFDHPDHLGTAHVLAETMTKGTAKRDGRALNDAFDEIGATHSAGAGRETITFNCLCLPEFFARAVELHAEMIQTPTLPDDACEIAVELTLQALAALDDDPHELAKKHLQQQAYGQPLGRHLYGEPKTLQRIGRDQILDHWQRCVRRNRMQIAVAGAVDPDAVANLLEKEFDGSTTPPNTGDQSSGASPPPDRPMLTPDFVPTQTHHPKDLQQEQIAICFPGANATDDDESAERALVGVLAGGMSSRLWSSVREKQGLVYWVGAWLDRPRTGGMVHLGASSTPENVEETYHTLLREIDRLAADVTQGEIDRAISGMIASASTRGDTTRAKATRIANDLFYYDKPIPLTEKIAKLQAVTTDDVRQYLDTRSRDKLSIVTLGKKPLEKPNEPIPETQKEKAKS